MSEIYFIQGLREEARPEFRPYPFREAKGGYK